ncbi:50S ribosomal protein L3 [candidate division FCPU426 bacterium]|nr:50S ribosomal protein L3 [candidate division FCPU426 bacterium]
MKSILGRKIGMTQVFDESGKVIPVTVVSVGPCTVVQVKTAEKDGYTAIQVGFEEKKPRLVKKPVLGQYVKRNLKPHRFLREIRLKNGESFEVGQTFGPEIFKDVAWVDVVGISKGKGFQGVVKRHKFTGGRNSHGSMFHRAPGSIGASSDPSRVLKGLGMPGHMGHEQVTAIKLKLVKIDEKQNLLLIRGAVPGANRDLVLVRESNRGGKK